jgi:uncharacterized membrane protein YfbV (UPF0208 family)
MTTVRALKLGAVVMLVALAFSALSAAGSQAATTNTAKLTQKQLLWLIEHANTPSQHEQLATYYRQQAQRLLQQAKEHEEMAAAYPHLNASKQPRVRSLAAHHCEDWAQMYTKQAKDAEALAAIHKRMAKEPPEKKR